MNQCTTGWWMMIVFEYILGDPKVCTLNWLKLHEVMIISFSLAVIYCSLTIPYYIYWYVFLLVDFVCFCFSRTSLENDAAVISRLNAVSVWHFPLERKQVFTKDSTYRPPWIHFNSKADLWNLNEHEDWNTRLISVHITHVDVYGSFVTVTVSFRVFSYQLISQCQCHNYIHWTISGMLHMVAMYFQKKMSFHIHFWEASPFKLVVWFVPKQAQRRAATSRSRHKSHRWFSSMGFSP